jgi:hypothetical protein
MTSADIRTRLVHALRLDLIGPQPDEPQAAETLGIPPSRWYLTGFLAPWNAPAAQKADADEQGELEMAAAVGGAEDDDSTPDPPAARRGQFPSSIGVSVLVPPGAKALKVTARWGDYEPVERDGKPTGEWKRTERTDTITVSVASEQSGPLSKPLLTGDGLDIVTSVRRVRGLEDLPGLPTGTRAASIFLVNRRAPEETPELKDRRFAFQAGLTIESDTPFVPRPNPRGRQDDDDPDERIADLQYRDVMEYAVGHGVSTTCTVMDGECRRVETTWMPHAQVERVEPATLDDVELRMETLAGLESGQQARSALEGLVTKYRSWIDAQRKKAPSERPQREVSDELLNRACLAADRIKSGLDLLDDPIVLDAFRLSNRAMALAGRQRRAQERGVDPATVETQRWRPFQLAFLLMNLRSIADPTHRDRELVDLLFFPTGGGKTEAYLGLAAFAIFLRRLRDPDLTSAGVTVLMRYTLRLLTLDQLSRAATLICAMEIIRKESPDSLGAWPFEVGLWVGKAATPNRMGKKGETDRTTARAKTIAYGNNSRKAAPLPIENCPWCGTRFKPTSFVLWPSTDEPRELKIGCANPKCAFRGNNPLPIVGVDEPLYRRAPCFVIATVDKFASLPWVGASGALLGGADRQDNAGFYGAWEPGVGQRMPKPIAPPDLIIQDELHLISGPLGTMAGLYEAAIDALCTRQVDGHAIRPKIVASTATVRRASDQVCALFARSGVEMFPPPGPDRRDSFFAVTKSVSEQPGRLYVGLAAQGRSLKVVLLRSYLALLGAAQKAWAEAGGAKEKDNPADPYMTLLGYFNSLRELGGSRRIVEDEVASRASAYGSQRRVGETTGSFADRQISRDVSELTSRERTDQVSDTKRRLALSFTDRDRIDVALATNMISVGLDITRLGLMVVLGQPKAAAEYIQATSRVGRDPGKPGLVVTLLNIHRPRDRSHFERFEAFHASFYRSVEATSVTPFAARALDRALPAVVVAISRHLRASLTPSTGAIGVVGERPALSAVADVLAACGRAHRARQTKDEEQRLDATLRARVKDLLDSWAKVAKFQQDNNARLRYQSYEGTAGPALLRTPLDPMGSDLQPVQDARKFKAPRSLRDVEPSVNLWLKRLDGMAIEIPADGDDT